MDADVTAMSSLPEPQLAMTLRARASTALRYAAPALVGYAAVRAVGLLVLWEVLRARGTGLVAALTSWDALWYLHIAEQGYDRQLRLLNLGRVGLHRSGVLPALPGRDQDPDPVRPAPTGCRPGGVPRGWPGRRLGALRDRRGDL